MSRTLAIIKPDAVNSGKAGKILAHLEEAGFTIKAGKMTRLTDAQAGRFYEVHRERPFYNSLVSFMTSGPCFPLVLEGEGAVHGLRETIGATDPAEAAPVYNTAWLLITPPVKMIILLRRRASA